MTVRLLGCKSGKLVNGGLKLSYLPYFFVVRLALEVVHCRVLGTTSECAAHRHEVDAD